MAGEDPYLGREQSEVKHFILRHYLERFAHIIGHNWPVISYVDCFSGPWNVRTDDLADSSFAIALEELRKARETHARSGRDLKIRCFFLEKKRAAYVKLRRYADGVTDAVVETSNAALEESIDRITDFVSREGRSFAFIFLDPTGWSALAMDVIAPLLQIEPGEVLINLMTGHIQRFIDSSQAETQSSFRRLFGSESFHEQLKGLGPQEREDALVEAYAANVMRVGRFRHVCKAIILHPEYDRTHYHLIYATRHPKGVEVFKDAERKAMPFQESTRAKARSYKRQERTHQLDLLTPEELQTQSHFNALREHYSAKSKSLLTTVLSTRRKVPYDEAWDLVLSQPMTWETDLKRWIKEWEDDGQLIVEGMEPRQKVPRRESGNVLVWT